MGETTQRRRKEEKDHAVNTIYARRKDLNIKATINKLQKALIQHGKDMEMGIVDKIKRQLTPHYLIIGHYTGEIIGCTCGNSGKNEVLAEEPLSTFKRISKRKCPVCKELKE